MNQRVFITGIGAVTGLGVGVQALWEGLLAGRSAIGPITRFDPSGFSCGFASEVKDFSAKEYVPKSYRKAVKVMARDSELAVAAAKCAAEDAGLVTRAAFDGGAPGETTYPADRMGCHIGAGLISAETQELAAAMVTAVDPEPSADLLERTNGFSVARWGTVGEGSGGGMNNLQPLWLLKYLPNMPACHVTIIHGAEGPSNTITCAEASGLLSIGESCRVIERGAADLCFSGSSESKLGLMAMARWILTGYVADTSEGAGAMRAYDPTSAGTIPGEAGALLVLEEAGAARRRGAKVYAEVVGIGAAQTATEDDQGEGLELAIRAALRDAKHSIEQVDAIVPQACGVPAVDNSEASALKRIFGSRLDSIPVIRVAPFVGNCAAGNGGLLAAVGAMCLKEQKLPAGTRAGCTEMKTESGIKDGSLVRLQTILVCSGAQGGQNAAILLKSVA